MSHLTKRGPKVEVVFVVDEVLANELDSKVEIDREMLKVGTELVLEYLFWHLEGKLIVKVIGKKGFDVGKFYGKYLWWG